jgi:uncharacterized small protein (DUF1192 family)
MASAIKANGGRAKRAAKLSGEVPVRIKTPKAPGALQAGQYVFVKGLRILYYVERVNACGAYVRVVESPREDSGTRYVVASDLSGYRVAEEHELPLVDQSVERVKAEAAKQAASREARREADAKLAAAIAAGKRERRQAKAPRTVEAPATVAAPAASLPVSAPTSPVATLAPAPALVAAPRPSPAPQQATREERLSAAANKAWATRRAKAAAAAQARA